jgi:NADH dehydrogenase FAD-containing subunit
MAIVGTKHSKHVSKTDLAIDHLIGSPLALASEQYASKCWVKFEDCAALQHPAIKILQGSVQKVDSDELKATILDHGSSNPRDISYDFLIAATGLRRSWPVVPQALTRAEYIAEMKSNTRAVQDAKEGVVVIGGGAVGVEMAAEMKLAHPSTKITLVHSRANLLSAEPLPETFKDAIAPLVRSAGVELVLDARVTSTTETTTSTTAPTAETPVHTLSLSNGTTLKASHILRAISQSIPTTSYLPPSSLDSEGYVKIAPTLHLPSDTPNARRHFAAGDIVAWSGIRRCGAAMHMGHHAAYNCHQQLLALHDPTQHHTPKFLSLTEHPPMIGLAVADTAIMYSAAEGTKSGADVMQMMFRDDLGWSICWDYLGLGVPNPPAPQSLGGDVGAAEVELRGDVEVGAEVVGTEVGVETLELGGDVPAAPVAVAVAASA